MTQQRRFTKEFEDEAVRLVRTSGRTRSLKISGWAFRRWSDGSAGAGNDSPVIQAGRIRPTSWPS